MGFIFEKGDSARDVRRRGVPCPAELVIEYRQSSAPSPIRRGGPDHEPASLIRLMGVNQALSPAAKTFPFSVAVFWKVLDDLPHRRPTASRPRRWGAPHGGDQIKGQRFIRTDEPPAIVARGFYTPTIGQANSATIGQRGCDAH